MSVAFGLDVSKATSQVVIMDHQTKVTSFKITNDLIGFNRVLDNLREYQAPQIVFEATGVYSRRVARFFQLTGYRYTQLNPLAARKQLDNFRHDKNDRADAFNLAKTQLILHRAATFQQDPRYQELMDTSRAYQQANEDFVRAKNRLHRVLQLTFPELESLFKRPEGVLYWKLVHAFPHPAMVQTAQKDLAQRIHTIVGQHMATKRIQQISQQLISFAQRSCPAVSEQSTDIEQVRYETSEIIRLDARKTTLIQKMVVIAKPLPELAILTSIPGIAATTAVLLIGELGDIRRFRSSNCLNAYVGIDLHDHQSGKYAAQRHISKRGNTVARKVLFKTIGNIVSAARFRPCHIRDFYKTRKGQSPKPETKKIAIAAIHRLLRTIYHLITHNQMYNYQVAKAKQLAAKKRRLKAQQRKANPQQAK
ncbi:IS110 family transposase [Lentilactobacillus diolivorans]|nr:IS110 family transposase [Lentilactobacillus diolivorans]MDH5107281.1 IS110 family transposase [Lentilactobacillus diolivorans]